MLFFCRQNQWKILYRDLVHSCPMWSPWKQLPVNLAITESTFTCYTFLMKSILTNTVKITVAAVLAILCAQALKLDFAVSAGIVAILSVQPTKKETLRTALARLLAFAVALLISITLLNLLGFTVPVFFLYLLIFILVCQWRKWIYSMAMDYVLISHFLYQPE